MAKICKNCGATKKSNSGNKCRSCASKENRKHIPKMRVETTCDYCSKIFFVKPSALKHGRGKCCSVECKAKNFPKRSQCELTCKRCDSSFFVTKSKKERGAKYCSRKCHSPPLIKQCLHCRKDFRTSPSTKHKFCSVKCSNSSKYRKAIGEQIHANMMNNPEKKKNWMDGIKRRTNDPQWKKNNFFQPGKDHPFYIDGNGKSKGQKGRGKSKYKRWRKSVLHRDKYTCQICEIHGGVLIAHHIKPWAEYPDFRHDIDNGLAVCPKCHDNLHGVKHIPKRRVCLNCQNEFFIKHNSQKYCNRDCYHNYQRNKSQ